MVNQGNSTLCVHAGNLSDDRFRGALSPIYPATVYDYQEVTELRYPRYHNTPNQAAVVEKLAALESAETGLLFSSGMAAISSTLLALLGQGDELIVASGLYGGTQLLVGRELPKRNITAVTVPCDEEAILAAISSKTRVIMVESPTNPLLDVIDLEKISTQAKKKKIITVIDNTFATPINQNPLNHGFDVVIHSGTKYLSGHSDLIFGAALASRVLTEQIFETSIRLGGAVNAQTAFLVERSLKTLDLRVRQQNENAGLIAEYLAAHGGIAQVNYPGLTSHPKHAVAHKQMTGFGGMLSFSLADNARPADQFLQRLKLIRRGVSLGGVESTICEPALTSHAKISETERLRQGITNELLRLSVGIENVEDLIADLDQALGS